MSGSVSSGIPVEQVDDPRAAGGGQKATFEPAYLSWLLPHIQAQDSPESLWESTLQDHGATIPKSSCSGSQGRSPMTDFSVAATAMKWCRLFGTNTALHPESPCGECQRISAAIFEALEEAEKIALNADERPRPGALDTGHLWRAFAARSIAAAIATLRGGR